MSDFDNFETAAPTEEDPAAEFLAREQDQLAGLEDDGYIMPAPQGGSDFGISEPAAGMGGDDLFDPLSQGTMPTTEDDAPAEEPVLAVCDFPDMENPSEDPFFSNDEPHTEATGYSAISNVDKERQEPEKIRLWREEQKKRLEEKDAESEKRKAEWREVAKHELEEWYKHRAEQFEKTKVSNREHEEALIQERDESIPGHEWERICRHCEFNPKHSGNKKDVARMRSILLQLKQSPLVR